MGCRILHVQSPIDVAPLATAILGERACPELFLTFDKSEDIGIATIQISNFPNVSDEFYRVTAQWTYIIDPIAVTLTYRLAGSTFPLLANSWHPRHGTTRLVLGPITDQP